MRRISALVGLIAAPTLIGSIYGMNFDHMPELRLDPRLPLRPAADGGARSLTVWIISKRAGWL